MGWLKWNEDQAIASISQKAGDLNLESESGSSLKDRILQGDVKREYAFQPCGLSKDQLPVIPAHIVQATRSDPSTLWIVIDEEVFDCTDFASIHPGGNTVIESFRGEDCSWQFWRFHSRINLETDGRPLRIGRTAGVPNRFKERPRFVGLRRLGADDG